jgi:hypothetical protein
MLKSEGKNFARISSLEQRRAILLRRNFARDPNFPSPRNFVLRDPLRSPSDAESVLIFFSRMCRFSLDIDVV